MSGNTASKRADVIIGLLLIVVVMMTIALGQYKEEITKTKNEIEVLREDSESTISSLESELESLSKDLSKKNDLIFNLNNSLEKMQGEISTLKKDNKSLQKTNSDLRSRLKSGSEFKTSSNKQTETKSGNGKSINVVATAYTAYCEGCTGKTFRGHDVRNTEYKNGYRVIATDPNVIPLGSLVKVESETMSFTGIADDIGGAIKGNKIDILVDSKNRANNFGVQNAKATIISNGG